MKKLAFTMAEILLSLTIIGVVAAITLPSLMGNINERTWNTQRKALHARMSQAIAMMPQLNGYGKYETDSDGNVTDTAAEAFLTEGLSKVLKINNICDSEHLADCGIASTMTNLNNEQKELLAADTLFELNEWFTFNSMAANISDTKAAAFETQNGESVIVYYNPYCVSSLDVDYIQASRYMCANFIYDLNGNKGPNAAGKDIGFISALYATDPVVVAPQVYNTSTGYGTYETALSFCSSQGEDSRLPNIEEWSAIFYNYRMFLSESYVSDEEFFSSTVDTVGENAKVRTLNITAGGGTLQSRAKSRQFGFGCVKR